MAREVLRSGAAVIQVGRPPVNTGPAPAVASGIAYAPLATPTRVSLLGTSFPAVRQALTRTFGDFPIRLSAQDGAVLAGMSAAAGEGATPYAEILAALEKFGELELRLE